MRGTWLRRANVVATVVAAIATVRLETSGRGSQTVVRFFMRALS
jgi:hypothetical protein